MVEMLRPTAKDYEEAVKPSARHGGASAKISFRNWNDYASTMTRAAGEKHFETIQGALDGIAIVARKTGNEIREQLTGQWQDGWETIIDLFHGMSEAAIELYGRTLEHDPAQANAFAAMSEVARGFTVIKGGMGCGKTTLMIDMITTTLAAGRRVLLLSDTHIKVKDLCTKLEGHLVKFSLDSLQILKARVIPDMAELGEIHLLIGTPSSVIGSNLCTVFHPDVIFGRWGILEKMTEPALSAIIAGYMQDVEVSGISPFIQFTDSAAITQLSDRNHDAHDFSRGFVELTDPIDPDDINADYVSPKFADRQLSLSLMQRMFLCGADAYLLNYQHR